MSEDPEPVGEETTPDPDLDDIARRVDALIEANRALAAAVERLTSLAERGRPSRGGASPQRPT
jgi:hypothetical protein